MAKKPQTRVIIQAGSRRSLVLSVKQNSNGSLFVRPATAPLVTLEEGQFEVVDERYSIHRSDSGGAQGNTFHYHLVTKNGPSKDGYFFTNGVKQGRAALLYAQLFRDLEERPVAITARPRDQVCNLKSYNPKTASLLMVVFIAPPSGLADIQPSDQFRVERLQFEHFSLLLAYAYSRQPSALEGRTLHVATGFSQDGIRNPGLVGVPDPGYDGAAASDFARAYLMMLNEALAAIRLKHAGGDPIMQRIITAGLSCGFGATPD